VGSLACVPSFSHSVDIGKPPEAVFPWLLEQDKVPQWTGDLQRYEQQGPLAQGARVKQVLDMAGGLTLDLEITRYDPPRGAESRFSTNGVNVVTAYTLEPTGAGTRLTQTMDANASGLTARMLIPVVQGRLEKKVVQDLERLRGVLEG
jgi:carbon monoxide dehydrogenase subunit G